MTSQPGEQARSAEPATVQADGKAQADRERAAVRRADVALRSMGQPNAIARQFDFADDSYEGRRLFSELLGTFFLVLVAVGGGMVNARFGGQAVPAAARVTAPGLMVAAIILFMGTVSGAHLNPVVSAAFALRGDFSWKRVPAYIAAQFAGAVLATLLLWALIGRQGSAGLTLPGGGVATVTAMLWEAVLTAGLVSVILGTASGAQAVGSLAAIAVGSYIVLAGLWGAPVSGASMNPVRSLGPALVLGDWTAWWAYLAGPAIGAVIAVGIAYVLRGPGGGPIGTQAAGGTLGISWRPGRIGVPEGPPTAPSRHPAAGPAEAIGAAEAVGPAEAAGSAGGAEEPAGSG
jgi:aquaporin Z